MSVSVCVWKQPETSLSWVLALALCNVLIIRARGSWWARRCPLTETLRQRHMDHQTHGWKLLRAPQTTQLSPCGINSNCFLQLRCIRYLDSLFILWKFKSLQKPFDDFQLVSTSTPSWSLDARLLTNSVLNVILTVPVFLKRTGWNVRFNTLSWKTSPNCNSPRLAPSISSQRKKPLESHNCWLFIYFLLGSNLYFHLVVFPTL